MELKVINIQSEWRVSLKQMERTPYLRVLFILYNAESDLRENLFLSSSGLKRCCKTRGSLLLAFESSSLNSCCLWMLIRASLLVHRWMTRPRCCHGNSRQPSSKRSSRGTTSSVRTPTVSQTRVSGRRSRAADVIVTDDGVDAAAFLIVAPWVTEAPRWRESPQRANKHPTRRGRRVTMNQLLSHTDVRPSSLCYGKIHFILGGFLPRGSIIDLYSHDPASRCGWFIFLARSV